MFGNAHIHSSNSYWEEHLKVMDHKVGQIPPPKKLAQLLWSCYEVSERWLLWFNPPSLGGFRVITHNRTTKNHFLTWVRTSQLKHLGSWWCFTKLEQIKHHFQWPRSTWQCGSKSAINSDPDFKSLKMTNLFFRAALVRGRYCSPFNSFTCPVQFEW